MSGRIRSLKPEWLDDERMALASDAARVLSVGLLLLADDYGNGRASTVMLAGRVFPGKPLETLANALAELAGWFAVLYELDGQRYFHIRNWDKHQKVDKPGKPRVPAPPEALAKVPETVDDARASRGSRSYAPDPDLGPGPDPGSGATAPEGAANPSPQPNVQRPPRNLADALKLPIGERASLVARDAHLATYLEPQLWTEVVAVAEALCAAAGRPKRVLAGYDRDTGVRAVVALYAAGYAEEDLTRAARALPAQPWWTKDGARRGLSALTPEVVDRALHGGDGLTADDRERVRAERLRLFQKAEGGGFGDRPQAVARAMAQQPSAERERFIDALERMARKRLGAADAAPLARTIAAVLPLRVNGGTT
jgi:hypothetical protein